MLIDFVTARCSYDFFSPDDWARLRLIGDRVQRYDPSTGEVRWESQAWDSVRSDSHGLAFRIGSDALWVQGSPARVCGTGCAVFGSEESLALDLAGCLRRMVGFLSDVLGVYVPPFEECWQVSRVDVTQNLLLSRLADVRVALRLLRECEGGRYRVSQQAGDTVYWSHKSRLRSGKAYAKGPHIRYMLKQKGYSGYPYSPEQIEASDRLLRLELSLKSQWFRERIDKKWYDLKAEDLRQEWEQYFMKMIGTTEILNDDDIQTKFQAVAKTTGQAKAAYCCWLLIKHEGWQKARESYPKSTWYRHLQIMHDAGLGDMDISTGNIVQFRRKIIESQTVDNWDDLLRAA